jgi:hypothetical protein
MASVRGAVMQQPVRQRRIHPARQQDRHHGVRAVAVGLLDQFLRGTIEVSILAIRWRRFSQNVELRPLRLSLRHLDGRPIGWRRFSKLDRNVDTMISSAIALK